MGYTTTFTGRFVSNKIFDEDTIEDIKNLSAYNPYQKTKEEKTASPYPASRCQWVVSKDNQGIEWDGVEKFYRYVDWLQYIVQEILELRGYTISGKVLAVGEEAEEDILYIVVSNNKVSVERFSKKEREEYVAEKEKGRLAKVGSIIWSSPCRIIYTHHLSEIFIHWFLFRGLEKSEPNVNVMAFIRERDGTIDISRLHKEEVEEKHFEGAVSLAELKQITACNSLIHRIFLRCRNVYALAFKQFTLLEGVYEIQDSSFLEEVRKYAPGISVSQDGGQRALKYLMPKFVLTPVLFVGIIILLIFLLFIGFWFSVLMPMLVVFLLIKWNFTWKVIRYAVVIEPKRIFLTDRKRGRPPLTQCNVSK